ncbi:MAG: thiamine biosynthesis protein ThiS [Bacteroidetes bacterium]|nr:thiamine biosynthesis protein ThiS [Bacteroidota bacterium]|tara:strand:+ start:195 stop:398 length:204 start_codon:yes stop_codon:yes gene_type:complete
MKITLNNRAEEIDTETMSVQKLIDYKNFTFKLLVTKINGELVRKDDRNTAMVKDGDTVVILHMISGG